MRGYGITFALILSFTSYLAAQDMKGSKVPVMQIKKMDGTAINTSSFTNNGKPIIIDFWATWCVPCVMELNAIADKYEYWKKETGVKLIIVSVDTVHNSTTVSSFVKNKGWQYEVYLDPDKDFQKAMLVMDTPCTFVVDGKGKITWIHNSYTEGDEDKVFEELKRITTTAN